MNLEGEKGVMKLYYNLIFFKKKNMSPYSFPQGAKQVYMSVILIWSQVCSHAPLEATAATGD